MKIKYGIDLGTTNSGIAKMNQGESFIVKNSLQKDTTPSCISYTKNKGVRVGDQAYNQLGMDKVLSLKKENYMSNCFIEFKRTMGSDKKYYSSHMEKEFSSEELSAEVLKELKSITQEDDLKSAVITVPALFNQNQMTATINAAKLAGIKQVKLLMEPIAAAMAYGLDKKVSKGKILMFDFGGGTFDVCLLNVEDGNYQVEDTEGDMWLGGKNLDDAIVNEIFIPHLQKNYKIESLIEDDVKNQKLRDALKVRAEQAKIEISFSDSCYVESNPDDYPNDDEGQEIELAFNITRDEMQKVLSPVFQKAIDITKEVLKRNNLDGKTINSLILVGGPTLSPILREMLEDQICKPDTSVDPMTVVTRGAAIFASTIDVSDEIKEEKRDSSKVQLDLEYPSQTTDTEVMLVVKVDSDKTSGELPSEIFVKVERSDGAWESDKTELPESGNIIYLDISGEKTNIFNINLFDKENNTIECEPDEISIIPNMDIEDGGVLGYTYGVELLGPNGKGCFYPIPGLEKGKKYPAKGEKEGLTTQIDLKPGSNNEINIPIYEGTIDAEGTRAVNQLWVATAILSGKDIPKLLPKGSSVNLILDIKDQGDYELTIDIPYLDEIIEKPLKLEQQKGEDDSWFTTQFKNIDKEILELEKNLKGDKKNKLEKIKFKVSKAKKEYNSNKGDDGTRMMIRDEIRKQFTDLDNLASENELPNAIEKLEATFSLLKEKGESTENEGFKKSYNMLKDRMDGVIASNDVIQIKDLNDQMGELLVSIVDDEAGVQLWVGLLINMNEDFDSHQWKDKGKARSILNNALSNINNLTRDTAIMYCQQLWKLLPNPKEKGGPDDILKT
tara:strand:- start:7893 stop:10415 length:2523 start_codon:yes stop_codon:yes gene_type:complete